MAVEEEEEICEAVGVMVEEEEEAEEEVAVVKEDEIEDLSVDGRD